MLVERKHNVKQTKAGFPEWRCHLLGQLNSNERVSHGVTLVTMLEEAIDFNTKMVEMQL